MSKLSSIIIKSKNLAYNWAYNWTCNSILASRKKGSSLLIIMIIMSVLSICCITLWQSFSNIGLISIERIKYEQKYRATECGIEYAINFCSKNCDLIFDPENVTENNSKNNFSNKPLSEYQNKLENNNINWPIELETGEFNFSENFVCKCKIIIEKSLENKTLENKNLENKNLENKKLVMLKSFLIDIKTGETIFLITCSLTKKKDESKTLQVTKWEEKVS